MKYIWILLESVSITATAQVDFQRSMLKNN